MPVYEMYYSRDEISYAVTHILCVCVCVFVCMCVCVCVCVINVVFQNTTSITHGTYVYV